MNTETIHDQSLPRESCGEPERIQKPLTMIGTVPLFCKSCRKIYFVKDLTSCPFCKSSNVVRSAIVHYAEPCDADCQDQRYADRSDNQFIQSPFKVPCQIDAAKDLPKPKNLTAVLVAVTCSRCLNAIGKKIDENGQLITFKE